jgi:hypothetical protein
MRTAERISAIVEGFALTGFEVSDARVEECGKYRPSDPAKAVAKCTRIQRNIADNEAHMNPARVFWPLWATALRCVRNAP